MVPCSEEPCSWGLMVCVLTRFFIILSLNLHFVSEVQWDKIVCTRVLENLSASHVLASSPSAGSHPPTFLLLVPEHCPTTPPLHSNHWGPPPPRPHPITRRDGIKCMYLGSSARAATIPTASWSPMGTHQVTLLGQVSCPPLTQVLLEPFEEVSIPWRITCLLWVDQRPMRREGTWSNFLPSSWQLAVAGLCMGAKLQEGVLRHLWEPVVTQHVSITTQLSLSEASHVHALL